MLGRDAPCQARGDVAVFHAVAPCAQAGAGNGAPAAPRGGNNGGIDVGGIGIGFIQAAVDADAELVLDNRPAHIKADAVGFAFFAVLRLIGVEIQRAVPFGAHFFGNDIDHAACRARAVTRCRRPTQYADGFDVFHGHPVAVAARVALAAPTVSLGIARGYWAAVNQNQRVFGPHAANVDLTFVAALARGGVAR